MDSISRRHVQLSRMSQAVCVDLSDSMSLLSLSFVMCYLLSKRVVDVPILVPIQESREDTMQVCACADEEEDNEEERLELEDAELDGWFMWSVCEDLEFLGG